MNRARLVKLILVALAVAAACKFLRNRPDPTIYYEREGIHDLRPDNPVASNYLDWLAHSADEFDAGVAHLTAWLITQKADGSLVRHHVATSDDWHRLHKDGKRQVVQLSQAFMDAHMPIQEGVNA